MIGTGILAALLEAFLNAFGRAINDFFGRREAEKAQRDLGATQAANQVTKETMETKDEMAKVAPATPDSVAASLRRGDF